MPVSLTTDLAYASEVTLKKALMVYGDAHGHAFVTTHAVTLDGDAPQLEPGTLFSVEELRELTRLLEQGRALALHPPNILATSADTLVWFEKAKPRVMYFNSRDDYLNRLSGQNFPQPALLFIASPRSLKVFALGSDRRPVAGSPLYIAPYYNTTAAGVCLGSTALPQTLEPADVDAYADGFFASEFTHGTHQQLVQNWGATYGQFWEHVQRQGRFPKAHLVKHYRTLGEVLGA